MACEANISKVTLYCGFVRSMISEAFMKLAGLYIPSHATVYNDQSPVNLPNRALIQVSFIINRDRSLISVRIPTFRSRSKVGYPT